MNNVISNILRFIVLFALQVLVVNNIQLLSFCNPWIYVYFLLLLPIGLPRWADLLIGFGCGLAIDIFSDSLGLHAAACTLLCFVRVPLIAAFVTDYERITARPGIESFGLETFAKYMVISVLLHHITVFVLESMSLAHPLWLLLRIITSTLATIVVIMATEFFRTMQKTR